MGLDERANPTRYSVDHPTGVWWSAAAVFEAGGEVFSWMKVFI